MTCVTDGADQRTGAAARLSSLTDPEDLIDTAIGLLAVALLIAANAFFVAAEFALVAVDRDRLEAAAVAGRRGASSAIAALRRLSFNLSGAQLGITITSLVLGFIAEPTIARALRPLLGFVPDGSRTGIAIALALSLATVTQMVLGELVPKGVAIAVPLRTAIALAGPVRVYGAVFGPMIQLLNGAADWTVRRLGIEPAEELRAVRGIEELELLIMSSGEEGTLEPEAFSLLTRTIRFGNKTAADALVPRVDLVTVPRDATTADLVRAARETGHSRFPVVGASPDDVVGVVHAKDVLRLPVDARAATPVTEVMRPALFIPEGRELEPLLTELRASGNPLAVVVDEYGGIAGIVTLEDLVEEIVGEIEDEHDPVDPPALTGTTDRGVFVVAGTVHADELREATGLGLPDGPYETLAGFLLDRLGHVPEPGERIAHDGWVLEVLTMDRRRIVAVRLKAPPGAEVPAEVGA